ncbi:O-antigen polymerase [Methylobacter sp. G7]|uniref:O-antigen polymerase n=1 Tax=Methylobacter sp. G7 TaxID=3230117 RepID=UPI003D807540
MNDFIIYVSVGMCLVMAIANGLLWRDIKSPAVLHSLLWVTIILLHRVVPHGMEVLIVEIYFIIFISMFLFSCGAILGVSLIGKNNAASRYMTVLPDQKIVSLYFYVALLGLPFLILRALDLASHGTTDNFFVNLRLSIIDEENPQGYGVISYFLPIAFSCFFLCLLDKDTSLKSTKIVFPLAICLIYAVFSTGRTFLFLLFIPSLFILSLTRMDFFTLGKALVFFGILLLVFFVIGSFLGRFDAEAEDVSAFWLYLLGGITAFQEIFSTSKHLDYGDNTFRTMYAILAALGFDVEVKGMLQDYVYIPSPTNVYTVFQPYFKDFGIYFALFMQFLFGLMHAVLYGFSKQKNPVAILLYSLSMYPLFMQWFQDQYFSLMSFWLFFAILLLLPFFNMTVWIRKSHADRFGDKIES